MKKSLLQKVWAGTSPPRIGVGHAFKNWFLGKSLSLNFNMKWAPILTDLKQSNDPISSKNRGGHTGQMFLDYFGLNELLSEEV